MVSLKPSARTRIVLRPAETVAIVNVPLTDVVPYNTPLIQTFAFGSLATVIDLTEGAGAFACPKPTEVRQNKRAAKTTVRKAANLHLA